jgi:hypothetical protein
MWDNPFKNKRMHTRARVVCTQQKYSPRNVKYIYTVSTQSKTLFIIIIKYSFISRYLYPDAHYSNYDKYFCSTGSPTVYIYPCFMIIPPYNWPRCLGSPSRGCRMRVVDRSLATDSACFPQSRSIPDRSSPGWSSTVRHIASPKTRTSLE